MGYRAQGCKELNTTDHAHALSPSSPHSLRPTAHLAFEGLHVRVDNHVCLEGLFLHKALVAEVALVGADVGVDQHVPLHVGQQRELPPADPTLVLLHALEGGKIQNYGEQVQTAIRTVVFAFLSDT